MNASGRRPLVQDIHHVSLLVADTGRALEFYRSRSGRAALFCRDPDGNGLEFIGA